MNSNDPVQVEAATELSLPVSGATIMIIGGGDAIPI
jgi:hypothetical protein